MGTRVRAPWRSRTRKRKEMEGSEPDKNESEAGFAGPDASVG